MMLVSLVLQQLSEVLTDPNCDTALEFGSSAQAINVLTGRYYSCVQRLP